MSRTGRTGDGGGQHRHLRDVSSPATALVVYLRDAKPLVELRVPFTVAHLVDDVERSAPGLDWDGQGCRQRNWRSSRTGIFEGYARGVDRRHPRLQFQPAADAARRSTGSSPT